MSRMTLDEFHCAWERIGYELDGPDGSFKATRRRTRIVAEQLVPAIRATIFGENVAPFSDPFVIDALDYLRQLGGEHLRNAVTPPE